MRVWLHVLAAGGLCAAAAIAQPPGPAPGGFGGQGGRGGPMMDPAAMLQKLMSLDANNDGRLTKEEIKDPRLAPLLTQMDANQDGAVSKEELTTFFQQAAQAGGFGGQGAGPGGPPGFGGPGPGGFGQGGQGAPGGPPSEFSAVSPNGELVTSPMRAALGLTEAQKKKLDALQKDFDSRLAKILTAEQLEELRELRRAAAAPAGNGFDEEDRPERRGPAEGERAPGPRDGERGPGPRGPRDGEKPGAPAGAGDKGGPKPEGAAPGDRPARPGRPPKPEEK